MDNSIGLSAPQLEYDARIFVINTKYISNKIGFDIDILTVINPEIIISSGDISTEYEGCLSIPNTWAKVPRYNKIKIEYQTIDGNKNTLSCDKILARAIQHEIDHLNGLTIVDISNNFITTEEKLCV
jgi:peptide deformylase